MDAQEEVMASNSSSSTGECPCPAVAKRKRTKRQRALPPLPSPLSVPIIATTTITTATASSSSSAEFSTTTEEEEDMAHCLILLAQGHGLNSPDGDGGGGGGNDNNGTGKFKSRKFTEAATTAGGKAGFYVYECKTCNKCFPSFQALGGHRASHKKPRLSIPPPAIELDHKKPIAGEFGLEICMNSSSSKPQVPNSGNKSSRIHECSICGSEFSSGQALGGHMRRHRPATVPESPEAAKKERNVLSLDLNLPAPSDENNVVPNEFAFAFAADKRPIVFSPSTAALVDCHY